MKRPFIHLWIALAMLVSAPRASAEGLNWDVDSFDVTITVRPDGVLEINERIVADFTRDPHRGIIRDIPYAYRRSGTSFKLRIEEISVTDDSGRAHSTRISRGDGTLSIRIGDANIWRRDRATYNIRYLVKRGLLGFDTHDELYWNAIGADWAVPIQRASCEVILPAGAIESLRDIRSTSFVGAYGSNVSGPEGTLTADGRIRFEMLQPLRPWNGMSIVVGFPTGHVAAATRMTRLGWFVTDNSILLAPLVVFGLLWGLWRWKGRDRGTPGTVVVQYEPPDGLSPVEVGAIIDERIDDHDISATIINLAVRGYLTIDVPGKDLASKLRLIRRKKDDAALKPFERHLLEALFKSSDNVKISSLQAKFFPTMHEIRSQVHKRLAHEGYFAGNLPLVRTGWMAAAVVAMAFSGIATGVLLANDWFAPLSTIIAAVASIPLFPIFAWHMPRKTEKGRRALEHIKGLEEYIARAELPTLELAAQQEVFEKLLPYAMALNLSEVWADRFADLYVQPEWMRTPSGQPMRANRVWVNVNSSSRTMTRAFTAMPRTQVSSFSGAGGRGSSWSSAGFGSGRSGFSSGGGFSGGGGGGGGGRGW